MTGVASWVPGKVAVVTGAARGLGTAFADALAGAGAALVLCDVLDDVTAVGADLADRHGVEVRAIVADVRRPGDVWRVVDDTVDAFGRIDVLVNNAGVWAASPVTGPPGPSAATLDDVVAVNTRAPFLFGRAVIPAMAARGDAHIVNIVTDHVYTEPRRPTGGGAGMDVYDASKWALNGLTLSWATELAGRVRVNGLCMGATDTWMLRSFWGGDPPEDVSARWKRPAQVAELLLDLLEEGPDGRSGWNLPVWVDDPIVMPPPSAPWLVRVGAITVSGPTSEADGRRPPTDRDRSAVAVVTGAGTPAGRASTQALRSIGITVVEVGQDVVDAEAAQRLVHDALDAHGRLDMVVLHPTRRPATPLDAPRDRALDDFDELFAADVATPFLVQRAATAALTARGGAIVIVTSDEVLPTSDDRSGSTPGHDVVDAARWASVGFTQAWALGLLEHGVRVNAIAAPDDDPAAHVGNLVALLAEGPAGRTGEVVRAGPGDLGAPLARGEEVP